MGKLRNTSVSQDIEFDLELPERRLSVLRFKGHCEFSQLNIFEVDVSSTDRLIADELLGLEARFKIKAALKSLLSAESLSFATVIVRVASLGQNSGLWLTRLQLCSKTYIYAMQKHLRIFESKTAIEVALEVIPDLVSKVDSMATCKLIYPVRACCTQYHETDLRFVQRILAEDGLCLYSSPANGQMEVHDRISLMSMLPEAVLDDSAGLEMRYAEVEKSFQMQGYNWRRPGAEIGHLLKNESPPQQFAQSESASLEGSYNRALSFWRTVMTDQQEREIYCGESMQSKVQIGGRYRIPEHLEIEGKLLVVRCDYVGYNPKYLHTPAKERQRGYFRCSFEGRDIQQRAFVVPNSWPKPKAMGLESGIVENLSGELAHDESGCIRVCFGWDKLGSNLHTNAQGSVAMRCVMPWTGDEFGMEYWPRTGQEVLVNFLNDDIDQPIALGMVYDKALPFEEEHQSGIKSRSTPMNQHKASFNELSFGDKLGEEKVKLHGEKDFGQEILNNKIYEIAGNANRAIGNGPDKGNSTEEMGSYRLACTDFNSEIKKERERYINGNYQLSSLHYYGKYLKKFNTYKIGSLNIYAGKSDKRSAGCIKFYEAAYKKLVQGCVDRFFDTNRNLLIQGERFRKIDADAYEEVKKNAHWKLGNWKNEVADTVEISSKKGITLSCGSNLITINKEGVTLFGKKLTYNDGGTSVAAKAVELEEPRAIAPAELNIQELNGGFGNPSSSGAAASASAGASAGVSASNVGLSGTVASGAATANSSSDRDSLDSFEVLYRMDKQSPDIIMRNGFLGTNNDWMNDEVFDYTVYTAADLSGMYNFGMESVLDRKANYRAGTGPLAKYHSRLYSDETPSYVYKIDARGLGCLSLWEDLESVEALHKKIEADGEIVGYDYAQIPSKMYQRLLSKFIARRARDKEFYKPELRAKNLQLVRRLGPYRGDNARYTKEVLVDGPIPPSKIKILQVIPPKAFEKLSNAEKAEWRENTAKKMERWNADWANL